MNTLNQEQWEKNWKIELQRAKTRPAMYIGDQKTAHHNGLSQAIRLIWKARAFNNPVSTTIHLAPTQYVLLCESGPLLNPIENLFSWKDKYVLTDDWSDVNKELREKRRLITLNSNDDLDGWELYFGGPSGPTLDSPIYPALLANRFAVAYKTSAGFWCQTFEDGWPKTKPYLVEKSSPIGFVIAGELNPKWFTGLPFTENDTNILSKLAHVTTFWHSQDDLEGAFQVPTELEKWL